MEPGHGREPSRFSDLDPSVQKFLRDLREKEIEELIDALELIRTLRTTGRFMRWGWITIVALAMGLVYISDGWRKVLLMIRGPG